jgi:hypothetical protein
MRRLGRTTLLLALVATLTGPVRANAASCTSSYPVTDKRLASHSCTGVHPGMALTVPSKKYGEMECVAGFVFGDQFGNRYVSVPGTCYLDFSCLEDIVVDQLPPPLNQIVGDVVPCLAPSDSELEPYYARNGPPVTDKAGARVGAIVYAVNKKGINFTLIRIDKGIKVDPAVPLYGGPTRLTGPSATPEEAYAYSAGSAYAPNADTGLLWESTDGMTHTPGLLGAEPGTVVVKPDGSGVGYYSASHFLEGAEVLPYGPAIARADSHAKLTLKLVTAPVA